MSVTDQPQTLLLPFHRKHLQESAIDEQVAAERRYETISRPNNADHRSREQLQRLGMPTWATREDSYFPGLLIPIWSPRGEISSYQWRPNREVPNRDGKLMKYASPKGRSVTLDVHPRWSIDRGVDDPALVPPIADPDMPLWITEGVKKADSLTSRGCVTVAITGVYNWRNTHGTLGDWEDVRIKGREVYVCFDADAITKRPVADAMGRLGRWLRSKGAAKVHYVVTPPAVGVSAVKGVDDFFAAGGSLEQLLAAASNRAPMVPNTSDYFTDASLAEVLVEEMLDGRFVWTPGLYWLHWNGRIWEEVPDTIPKEAARQWARDRFADCAERHSEGDPTAIAALDQWHAVESASKLRNLVDLARGILTRRDEEFDADPDLLNTPNGVVHLKSGELMPHTPELMQTKITSGNYMPGFVHTDWTKALEAVPADIRRWLQARVGQAITGHTTPDGMNLILQGGGENGKGAVFTDGLLPALGGYASVASPKIFMNLKNEHSTERADLKGQRLVIVEELTEGRSINVTALKQISDVGRMRARRTHRDNMEWDASHSIFATTNYVPVVAETDHGTWRRLKLVKFPYTFRKPGEHLESEFDRAGDETLKERIKANRTRQHDAIVTWAVEGAIAFYAARAAAGDRVLAIPQQVEDDTRAWRIEADRILGYWAERLVSDPAHDIMTTELEKHFNAWLKGNGHSEWPKETFNQRFENHVETKKYRVVQKQSTQHDRLSMRPDVDRDMDWLGTPKAPLPRRPKVWVGVRFRLDSDDAGE